MRDRLVVGVASVAAIVVLIASCRTAFNGGTTGDFPIFWTAAKAMHAGEPLDDAGAIGYVYPPLFAAMLAPTVPLGQHISAIAWSGVSFVILLTSLWLGARDAVDRWRLSPRPIVVLTVALIGGLLTIILFRAVFRGGQSDHLLIFGFMVGLAFVDRRPSLSGCALGFAANIKYTALGMVPLLLLRRKYKAAAWTVVFAAVWALVPALLSGWTTNLDNLALAGRGFLEVLGKKPSEGTAAAVLPEIGLHRSLSLTSVLSRTLLPEPGHAALYGGVLIAALACLLLGWWCARRAGRPLWTTPTPERPSDRAAFSLEWSGMIVAMLMFSPQTQVRHLVVIVALHLLAAALLMRSPRGWPWIIAVLAAFQLSLILPSADLTGEASVAWGRQIGLQIWTLAAMFFVVLGVGLRESRRLDTPTP